MKYDYIIAGAGCAGMSLLVHMIQSGSFADKRILLVDKVKKNSNDRTWCFWETTPGMFEPIVFSRWQQAWFHGEKFSRLLQIAPYTYKLIRGVDFYQYCLGIISKQSNIEMITGELREMVSNKEETFIVVNGQKINADFIFNSILTPISTLKAREYYLLQHFKGWVIETEQPLFNVAETTLMDFRVDQSHGTTFVYVMPFSSTSALVEYTLFTENLLEPAQYEDGLRRYIKQFVFDGAYSIKEEEFGIIPMTNYRFPRRKNNIINIGTAGGQTKASSGYTFQFIQKHSASIVERLIQTGKPFRWQPAAGRFHFYDSVLLNILYHKILPGQSIFTGLFKKNQPQQVLRFLDNESSWKDELKIISSLPARPFLKAALKQL